MITMMDERKAREKTPPHIIEVFCGTVHLVKGGPNAPFRDRSREYGEVHACNVATKLCHTGSTKSADAKGTSPERRSRI